MNGLRTRLNLTLDADRQREHNRISHAGDRAVMCGVCVLGALYLILRAFGVVA